MDELLNKYTWTTVTDSFFFACGHGFAILYEMPNGIHIDFWDSLNEGDAWTRTSSMLAELAKNFYPCSWRYGK